MTPRPTFADEYQAILAEDSDIKDELPYLLGRAGEVKNVRVLELGVRTGRSTSAFLTAAQRTGGHVYSIDIAEKETPPHWDKSKLWSFHQGDDMDVVPELIGWPNAYDVLFIDTSHTIEHTLAELRRFVPYVAEGGVVLCHDTRLPGRFVARALDLFCGEYPLQAQLLPWDNWRPVPKGPLKWLETGGRWGVGVIEAPNG